MTTNLQGRKPDFAGYATRANVKCGDGRTILPDAFKECDGKTVTLVWQHMHNDPTNILGHGLLENRPDGVYLYGFLNTTKAGANSKLLVQQGDITSLSVYANELIEKSKLVMHGVIREVSLVLAGKNPGAKIDYVSMEHSDGEVVTIEDEAIVYSGENFETGAIKHEDAAPDGETIEHVYDTFSEKQKEVLYVLIDNVIKTYVDEQPSEDKPEEIKQSSLDIINEGDEVVKSNAFDKVGKDPAEARTEMTHSELLGIMEEAKANGGGSLKKTYFAHAGTYGIDNISLMFPDARAVTNAPEMVTRDMEWVSKVLDGTRKTPFSRIKSLYADITVESARALGYVTGNLKKDEVFAILHRVTEPQTIYKKQKLDRDEILDITDFDVVTWLKSEMKMMLREELARAVLISDGRDPVTEADDKIKEDKIRPIWKDSDIYAHKVQVALAATPSDIIDAVVTARTNYKGSGSPTLYTSTTLMTSLLLMKDNNGYRLYKSLSELAAALLVSSIVEVPLMDNQVREAGQVDYGLLGIITNLKDYVIGADKGGETTFFEDFDIDFNQQKYLYETRCSGALVKPKSALVIERATS